MPVYFFFCLILLIWLVVVVVHLFLWMTFLFLHSFHSFIQFLSIHCQLNVSIYKHTHTYTPHRIPKGFISNQKKNRDQKKESVCVCVCIEQTHDPSPLSPTSMLKKNLRWWRMKKNVDPTKHKCLATAVKVFKKH